MAHGVGGRGDVQGFPVFGGQHPPDLRGPLAYARF